MDVSQVRHRVFADNIANADTPHFKRSEVSFEAELRRVLDSEKVVQENEFPAKLTTDRHLPFFRAKDYRSVNGRTHLDYLSTMRNDGNNVDPEHEVSQSVKNQLSYQAMSTQISNNFKLLNIVIRSA